MSDEDFKCKKCGECCRKHPCYLEPDDLPKIAEFLGINEHELISKYLVWHNSFKPPDKEEYGVPKLYPFPNRVDYKPIRLSNGFGIAIDDFDESNSPCIFLDENNLCKIHLVKPIGGELQKCTDDFEDTYSEEVLEKWQTHPNYPFLDIIKIAKEKGLLSPFF